MSIPVLVVDDQIASSKEEQFVFLRAIGEMVGYREERRLLKRFDVVFCQGQLTQQKRIDNDISVVLDAVAKRSDWALILIDLQFDSGQLGSNGLPSGQQGDSIYGLTIEKSLNENFSNLPLVRFTSKREQEIDSNCSPYLAKLNLSPGEFRMTLLTYGRLSLQQKLELLEIDDKTFIASPVMIDVYCQARKYAITSDPVLVLGESGTGKEVLANYIHQHSRQSDSPFIPVNVAAMPEHLVDSQLFGHERGAFTGADRQKRGCFEQAGNGTVFLDEVGDMPLAHQLRLLRVLEERQFRRVGGTVFVKFTGRVILATHQNLHQCIDEGSFRLDLLNRLTLSIVLPPLRDRVEEVRPLADRFLAKSAVELRKEGLVLDESALNCLEQYDFSGNVRELAALMKVVAIRAGNNRLIRAEDLPIPTSLSNEHSVTTEGSERVMIKHQPFSALALEELHKALLFYKVTPEDNAIQGIKPLLESAVRSLLCKCAVICLKRCKHPVTGKIRLLPAMQLLTGNTKLKGTGAKRVLNDVLGRNQSIPITLEELEELCKSQ